MPRTPKTASSLSGPSSASNCDLLRQQYAESQACFALYRVANGSVRRKRSSGARTSPIRR